MSTENQIGLQAGILKIIERNMSVQGFSGVEMSRRMNTSPAQIYRVLRGENCNVETLQSMLSVLGVSIKVAEGGDD